MSKKTSSEVTGHAPSRRQLFKTGAAAVGVAAALPALLRSRSALADDISSQTSNDREREAYNTRVEAANYQKSLTTSHHPDNGDEARYPDHSAMYHKSLPHDDDGLVDPAAYALFIQALASGEDADFSKIPTGNFNPLHSPQSAYARTLVGPDSHAVGMRPAPAFASAETAGEMVEVYWQALTRNVNFASYESDPTIARACEDLSRLSDFRGPKENGRVTPKTLFRGDTPGDLQGYYISQFLLRDVPYGGTKIVQRYPTRPFNYDHMTTWDEWLAIQRGQTQTGEYIGVPIVADPLVFDPVPRYIRNNRDLATYVHRDWAYQSYVNAALICLSFGKNARDQNNPYFIRGNQTGFLSFGHADIFSTLGIVSDAAFKAAWYHKWLVHRRLRPEVYAARVHTTVSGGRSYPVHSDVLESDALAAVDQQFGSLLLPMAYREGSPAHPAYPAGHAVVAGACVTVLKAFFNENYVIKSPVQPDADGLVLLPLHPLLGTPEGPRLGDELDKLAANISIGRDAAGVHYRSDGIDGLLLGEEVAIRVLRDMKLTYNEPFEGFSVRKFDGTRITI